MTPVRVTVAADRDRDDWERFVESQPDATGYHEWAWRQVFERAFHHQCMYLLARRSDGADGGAVVGVLPLVEIRSWLFGRSLTSLPFVNYGGVLAETESVARALVEHAAQLAQSHSCRHVELRHFDRRFGDLPYRQHKVTMRTRLAEGMWDRIDRKARNQVRKAQKSDLQVVRGGQELVPEFYSVFARNMRDLGTPVYGRQLFDEVLRAFPARVRVIVVRLKGKAVAAGLTYRTGNLMQIPWASSIRDFNSLCPNHLLYWHAIETAAAERCTTFDLGRSTPGEGTFKFKQQWGAEPVPLHWEYWLGSGDRLPDQSPANPKYRVAIESWKRLPLWLANAVGPSLVRNIP